MNSRFIFVVLFLSSICFLHAQNIVEAPWSECSYDTQTRRTTMKMLNNTKNRVKKSIRKGRESDGKNYKLPDCKIKEIEDLYEKLIFEFDCGAACPGCGVGSATHSIKKGLPYIRICDPIVTLEQNLSVTDKNTKPPKGATCGCIEGLITHELIHAAGDLTEEGAVDCSKMLYPCASDPYGDETPDHSNCDCCDQ